MGVWRARDAPVGHREDRGEVVMAARKSSGLPEEGMSSELPVVPRVSAEPEGVLTGSVASWPAGLTDGGNFPAPCPPIAEIEAELGLLEAGLAVSRRQRCADDDSDGRSGRRGEPGPRHSRPVRGERAGGGARPRRRHRASATRSRARATSTSRQPGLSSTRGGMMTPGREHVAARRAGRGLGFGHPGRSSPAGLRRAVVARKSTGSCQKTRPRCV